MSKSGGKVTELKTDELQQLSSSELVLSSSSHPFTESPVATPQLLRQRISSIFGKSPQANAKLQRASFALQDGELSDTASIQTSRRASLSRNSKRLSLGSISFNPNDSGNDNNEFDKDDVLSNTNATVNNDSQRAFRPLRNFTPRSSVAARNVHKVGSKTPWRERNAQQQSNESTIKNNHNVHHAGKRSMALTPCVRVVTSFRGNAIPEYRGPLPRVGHTAVMYARNLYIFGGVNHKGNYNSHLFRHERRSFQWEEVHSVGVIPCGRANHSAILTEHHMFIYGGHRELDVFDDLFSFDFRSSRWDKIPFDKSQSPGPVFLHAAVYIPVTQSMAVIGGFHQREHNTHIGHFFDIRNRVWSGILAPPLVNPHYLQLVTAAFFAPQDVIIVIGILRDEETQSNMLGSSTMAPLTEESSSSFSYMSSRIAERDANNINKDNMCIIHLLNVHTQIWTEVRTSASPESPIPFRLERVWDLFLNTFVRMGGYYDDHEWSWYFPLNLQDCSHDTFYGFASTSENGVIGSPSVSMITPPPLHRRRYGFFTLRLMDMTWSILPASFPKKILAELSNNANNSSSNGYYNNNSNNNKNKELNATSKFSSNIAATTNRMSITEINNTKIGSNTPVRSRRLHSQTEEQEFIRREQQEQRRESWKNEGIMMRRNTNDMRRLRRRASNSLLRSRASITSNKYNGSNQRNIGSGGGSKRNSMIGSAPFAGQTTSPVIKEAINVELDQLAPRRTSLTNAKYNARWRDELNSLGKHSPLVRSQQSTALSVHEQQLQRQRQQQLQQQQREYEESRYGLLYSVHGHPQFEHKYVFAAYRERDGKRNGMAMQYFIMHGGLSPSGRDYTMLMFTPVITRVDALTSQKLTDRAQALGTMSLSSAESSATRESLALHSSPSSISAFYSGNGNKQSSNGYTLESYSAFGDSYTGAVNDLPTPASESLAIPSQSPCDNTSALLPSLPCNRTERNMHRFAILFHSHNSVHNTDLLPYQSTPVAVLENEAEILKWSHNYYKDERSWIATQLKSAIAEDKQTRRRLRQQLRAGAVNERGREEKEEDAQSQQQGEQQQQNNKRRSSEISRNNLRKDALMHGRPLSRTSTTKTKTPSPSPLLLSNSTAGKRKVKTQTHTVRVDRNSNTAANAKSKKKVNVANKKKKKYSNTNVKSSENKNTLNKEMNKTRKMTNEEFEVDTRAPKADLVQVDKTKNYILSSRNKSKANTHGKTLKSNKSTTQSSHHKQNTLPSWETNISNQHLSSSLSSSSSSSSSSSALSSSSNSSLSLTDEFRSSVSSSFLSESSSLELSSSDSSASTFSTSLPTRNKIKGRFAERAIMSGAHHHHQRKRHGSGRRAHRAKKNKRKEKLLYGNYSDDDNDDDDTFYDKDTWAVNKKTHHGQNKYSKDKYKESKDEDEGDVDDESEERNKAQGFFVRRQLNCFDVTSFGPSSSCIFFPRLWNCQNAIGDGTGRPGSGADQYNIHDSDNMYDNDDNISNNNNMGNNFLESLHLPGLERLSMPVKRHMELQRLPAHIFERGSQDGINVSDLGSAMTYVLLHNALAALPNSQDPLVRAERTRRRWNFLRALVCTGEAAFILYRASQEAARMSGIPVSSTPGLMMAPELNLVGPTRSYKIVTRPVPYNLPRTMLPTLSTQRSEVSSSGMVGYNVMR